MKKSTWIVVAIIVIVAIFIIISRRANNSGGAKTIKIGVVAPLTGGGAAFGNSLVKAIELAQQDLKDTHYTYKIIIEDDGTNPAQSAGAAQKLINVDKVQAIISATSGTGNVVAPLVEAAKIPQICTACADKKVGTGKYSYTSSVQVEDEARVFVDYAIKTGAKSLGMISQIHPGINAVADAIKIEAASKNLPVVYEERFDGNNRDFNTIVKKAVAAKASLYFLQSFPPSLDIIGKEFTNLGITNVAGGAGAFTISADLKIFEGHWYTEALSDPMFTARFQTAFPDIRFNIRTGPYGYDAFNILVQGFEKNVDMAVYLAGLKEFNGKVGRQYKTDGNYFRSMPGIWIIKEGKPVMLGGN